MDMKVLATCTSLLAGTIGFSQAASAHTAGDIADKLINRGYHRVVIVDGHGPVYNFRACHHRQRYHIRANEYGEILGREHLGRCHGRFRRAWNRWRDKMRRRHRDRYAY